MALAPASNLALAERADFAVETCTTIEQAAKIAGAKAKGGQALVAAAAVESCIMLLAGMSEVLQTLPTLPATSHQAEASLTQQALMLLGKVSRRAIIPAVHVFQPPHVAVLVPLQVKIPILGGPEGIADVSPFMLVPL